MTATKQGTSCSSKTILRILGPHDRARSLALGRYRALGGSLDAMKSRSAREKMCAALTYAEDQIEILPSGRARVGADRDELRELRRSLELELWP